MDQPNHSVSLQKKGKDLTEQFQPSLAQIWHTLYVGEEWLRPMLILTWRGRRARWGWLLGFLGRENDSLLLLSGLSNSHSIPSKRCTQLKPRRRPRAYLRLGARVWWSWQRRAQGLQIMHRKFRYRLEGCRRHEKEMLPAALSGRHEKEDSGS